MLFFIFQMHGYPPTGCAPSFQPEDQMAPGQYMGPDAGSMPGSMMPTGFADENDHPGHPGMISQPLDSGGYTLTSLDSAASPNPIEGSS